MGVGENQEILCPWGQLIFFLIRSKTQVNRYLQNGTLVSKTTIYLQGSQARSTWRYIRTGLRPYFTYKVLKRMLSATVIHPGLRPYFTYKVLKRLPVLPELWEGLRPYFTYKVLKQIAVCVCVATRLRPYFTYKVLKLRQWLLTNLFLSKTIFHLQGYQARSCGRQRKPWSKTIFHLQGSQARSIPRRIR